MTSQEIQIQKQEILKEIGQDWIPKEKSSLVSYGTVNLGMPRKEAEDLADFTLEEMLTDAAKRKVQGMPWRMLFQPCCTHDRHAKV